MIDDWIVAEIKTAINRTPDIPSLNATTRHYAKQYAELRTSKDRSHRTMAIQIKNLADYRRKLMFEDARR